MLQVKVVGWLILVDFVFDREQERSLASNMKPCSRPFLNKTVNIVIVVTLFYRNVLTKLPVLISVFECIICEC